MNWNEIQAAAQSWLLNTFGADRVDTRTQLRKLAKEAAEAVEAPPRSGKLLDELADCRVCLLTAEALSGFTDEQIQAATAAKLAVLAKRKWYREADGTFQSVPGCDALQGKG